MMVLIIAVHVTACIALIGLVLIQRGRGGGLVESFSGVESMFGTKTSTFLTRATTILSIVFFITCLSLAVLSIRQSRSLMTNIKVPAAQPENAPAGAQATETKTPQAPAAPETPVLPPAQQPQPEGAPKTP